MPKIYQKINGQPVPLIVCDHFSDTVVGTGIFIKAPTVTGDSTVVTGMSGTYNLSAIPGLNDTIIEYFEVTVGTPEDFESFGGDPYHKYTFNANNNAATATINIPEGFPVKQLALTVVACDSLNNKSQEAVYQFATISGGINAPSITAPTTSATLYKTGFTVTASAFTVTGSSDTHVSTDWLISSNADGSSPIVSALNSSDKTSHAFSSSDLNSLAYGNTYYVLARYKGSKFGYSPYSTAIQFTIGTPTVKTPSITSPASGASVTFSSSGVTLQSSAFGVNNGTGTHSTSDWKICTDSAGNNAVLSSAATTNKTSCTFSASSCQGNLVNNTTYYAFVRHNSTEFGSSKWSSGVSFVAKAITVNTPTITSPTSGATITYNANGIVLTSSAFGVTNGSDTHASSDWKICSNSSGSTTVLSVSNSSDKLSHTFSASDCSSKLTSGTTYYAFVRHKGTAAGYSSWSSGVSFVAKAGTVNKPSITSPTANATIYTSQSLTVTTSSFSVSNGTDTHKNTDYRISSGTNGSNIVAQALASTDKTSHIFTANDLTGLVGGNDYYISARHRGTTLGESQWSSPVHVIAKAGQIAPGNRTVYRHSSLPGSVIEYNEFGVEKRILVADAAYRGTAPWKTSYTAVSGVNQWSHNYYPTCTANVIDSYTGWTELSSVADLTPYSDKLTDAHFQAALTSTLKPVLQTAKEATDAMIRDGTCPAATFVRNKSIGVQLQLPNIYQLLVMYACGDLIDALDPTLAQYPTHALGKTVKNNNRWPISGAAPTWASTDYSDTYTCGIYSDGHTGASFKRQNFGVVPVAEI